MRTSGATVVFSGITVIVSLAGLFLINSTVMRSLAIGAIVVVAIAIVGAVTLLPALIALLGDRADKRGKIVTVTGTLLRRIKPKKELPPGAPTFWERWSNAVMKRSVALGRCWPPSCCSRSPSPRSRSSSATARCASSRRPTRRGSAPSWPRRSSRPASPRRR